MPPNAKISPSKSACYHSSDESRTLTDITSRQAQGTQHHSKKWTNTTMQPRHFMPDSIKRFERPRMCYLHPCNWYQPLQDYPANIYQPLRDYPANVYQSVASADSIIVEGVVSTRYDAPAISFVQPTTSNIRFAPCPTHLARPAIPPSSSSRIPDHGLRLLSACIDLSSRSFQLSSNAEVGQEHKVDPDFARADQNLVISVERCEVSSEMASEATAAHNRLTETDSVADPDLNSEGQPLECAAIARDTSAPAQASQLKRKVESPYFGMKFAYAFQTDYPKPPERIIVVREVTNDSVTKKARLDDGSTIRETRATFGGNSEQITILEDKSVLVPRTDKPCKCNRSQCLKLYCECFGRGKLCDSLLCKCQKCLNTEKHDVPGGPRRLAVSTILVRRSDAFERLDKKKSAEGCSCKKTNCLKKYCICYGMNRACSSKCKCLSCSNTEAEHKVPHETGSVRASGMVTAED